MAACGLQAALACIPAGAFYKSAPVRTFDDVEC